VHLSSKCFLCGLETGWVVGWVYWKERTFCIIAYWLWSVACSLWFPLGLPLPCSQREYCTMCNCTPLWGAKWRDAAAHPLLLLLVGSTWLLLPRQNFNIRRNIMQCAYPARAVDLHACLTNQRAPPLPLNEQNEFPLLLFVCLQNTLAYIIGFGLGKHWRRNVCAAR
jgi:hypothetical protein